MMNVKKNGMQSRRGGYAVISTAAPTACRGGQLHRHRVPPYHPGVPPYHPDAFALPSLAGQRARAFFMGGARSLPASLCGCTKRCSHEGFSFTRVCVCGCAAQNTDGTEVLFLSLGAVDNFSGSDRALLALDNASIGRELHGSTAPRILLLGPGALACSPRTESRRTKCRSI